MILPVPVTQPSSGGSVVLGPVVEREIAPFQRYLASTEITHQDMRDYLDLHGAAAYSFNQVYLDLITVGGGGGGVAHWDYSKGLFGGFPGSVVRARVRLSDIWATSTTVVALQIGAGGTYEGPGSDTVLFVYDTADGDSWSLRHIAFGGQPGTHPETLADPQRGLAEQSSRHEAAALLGYQGVDLSKYAPVEGYIILPPTIYTGNIAGPGIGGCVFSIPISETETLPGMHRGGDAVCLSPSPRKGGVAEIYSSPSDPVDGQDADPAVFDSFGGGGGVGEADPNASTSGVGGRGGRPGGGGGPCLVATSEFFGSGGDGGDGGVAFRFTVLEAAQ